MLRSVRQSRESWTPLPEAAEPLAMSPSSHRPQVRAESARALCRGCGGPLVGRQWVACSSRCRAVVSRQRKVEARRERDAEIRALLEAALKRLQEGES
jgi:hypothetical protein